MASTADQQLEQLQQGLASMRGGGMSIAQWGALAQGARELKADLPERFDAVLTDLLNRLEASGLFSEDSCSFSQGQLFDSLQLWLEKADQVRRRPGEAA